MPKREHIETFGSCIWRDKPHVHLRESRDPGELKEEHFLFVLEPGCFGNVMRLVEYRVYTRKSRRHKTYRLASLWKAKGHYTGLPVEAIPPPVRKPRLRVGTRRLARSRLFQTTQEFR